MIMQHNRPMHRVAALIGATASGKTATAIALRRDHGLPIEAINLDALQIYRRLSAGTAKPDAGERAALPYHLIDCAEPTEAMNAARFAALADAAIADVHGRGAWPLLVGGTGLYLRAVLQGMAEIPQVACEVRVRLAQEWQERGQAKLHAELAAVDPAYAARTPAANRQRVLRALEVWRATGRPFSQWHQEHAQQPDRYVWLCGVLQPPEAELRARIAQRAAAMAAPLLAEVAELLSGSCGLSPQAPAMQALGYRDAVAVLRGDQPADGFAARLAHAHWLYARRQRTWFRSLDAQIRLRGDPSDIASFSTLLRTFFTQDGAALRPPRA